MIPAVVSGGGVGGGIVIGGSVAAALEEGGGAVVVLINAVVCGVAAIVDAAIVDTGTDVGTAAMEVSAREVPGDEDVQAANVTTIAARCPVRRTGGDRRSVDIRLTVPSAQREGSRAQAASRATTSCIDEIMGLASCVVSSLRACPRD